jgi:hypothetical protein
MATTRKASRGRQRAAGEPREATTRRPARKEPSAWTRRPGRPLSLTQALAEAIVETARAGNYLEVAAQAHGVPKSTLYGWLSRAAEFDDATQEQLDGLDDETAGLVWFSDALRKAEAEAEAEAVACVRSRPNRWQAEAWFLERRHQARYRQHLAAEHSGEVGVRAILTPEQEREELAAFGMPAALSVAAGPESVTPPDGA